MEVDRISNLPLDLTHKILECLSVQEAAKTSVLSKYWRFKWASTPQLILDMPFFNSIHKANEYVDISSAYSNAVNNILLNRVEPISKFVLYIPYWFPRETYKWVRYVCANNVKELTLKYSDRLRKNLPECLLTCSGLTHLTLIGCKHLSLHPSFKGFPCLIYLRLETCVAIEAKVVETLISKCSKLESIHLMIFDNACLTIHAPKLENLFVKGYLNRLCLKGTTALNTLGLAVNLALGRNEIFNCFANIENLVLIDCFGLEVIIQYMCNKTKPKEFGQLRILNLEYIQLNPYNISFVLNLLTSSSQLERLSIKAKENTEVTDDHSIQIECCYILECLRYAQLLDISGSSGELQLIKYILAHSPVLKEMTIELSKHIGGAEEKFKFATEVTRYHRASPKAEIIIKAK